MMEILKTSARYTGFLAFVAMVVLQLSACDSPFDARSSIQKLRILAIKATSPTLRAGDTTTLSALVVSPDNRAFSLHWEVCVFTSGANDLFACPEAEDPQPGAPTNKLVEGDGEVISFTYDPQLQFAFKILCEQQAEFASQIPEGFPLPTCDLGFPLRVRLVVTETDTGEMFYAVKTIYMDHEPTGKPVEINRNPVVSGLLPDAGSVARVGGEIVLHCDLDPTSLERFTPIGDDEQRDEEVLFSWFTTRGALSDDLTLFSELGKTLAEAATNTLVFDAELVEAGPTTVWCVARDGRGGMDWASLEFEVVP